MDFYQFFMKPEKLDIESLKDFFKSYNLNSSLIGMDYVNESVDEYYFTFCCNETFGLESHSFDGVKSFFDDDIVENDEEKDEESDGNKLKEILLQKSDSKEGLVYKVYFNMGRGGHFTDNDNNVIYLSDEDVALYTYVYALYLSKHHNGILYYSNSGVFITDEVLEELVNKGLNGDLKFNGMYIIDKKRYEMDENYYKSRADNGDVPYQIKLGYLYEKHHDIENAVKYYKMAADAGNTLGQFNLGVMYENLNDKENAEKYYKMAADNGKASAQFNLAYLYEERNDMNDAMKYYEMAANNGSVDAQYNLGIIYKNQNDIENAIKYYKMAADNGDMDAKRNLEKLYNNHES